MRRQRCLPAPALLLVLLLAASLCLLTPTLPVALAAGPQPGQLQLVWVKNLAVPIGGYCMLQGDGLGLTSLTREDMAPYVGAICRGDYEIAILSFTHNSLRSLGPSVFKDIAAASGARLEIDMSHNLFTADDLPALFANTTTQLCALCDHLGLVGLDLSYNPIGPVFPTEALRGIGNLWLNIYGLALFMISCGITDIPTEAMLGITGLSSLDISLNNLRDGLHPFSFSGVPQIACSYCNLRTESLPANILDNVFYRAALPSNQGSGKLHLINEIWREVTGYLPKAWVNDSRVFTKDRFTPQNATEYVHRLPTPEEYILSMSNCFLDFPTSLFNLTSVATGPSGIRYTQPTWDRVALGDVVSFRGFLMDQLELYLYAELPTLAIVLAPQLAVVALGLDPTDPANSCPLSSLLRSLTHPKRAESDYRAYFTVSGYDLPLPSTTHCEIPSCANSDCSSSPMAAFRLIKLPVEPHVLVPGVAAWLSGSGYDQDLWYTTPTLGIWNPALNRSDWIDSNLFKSLTIGTIIMPFLPYSEGPAQPHMPHPPPDGLLAGFAGVAELVDFSDTKFFSSNMLQGFPNGQQNHLTLDLRFLYRGDIPVPVNMFDPVVTRFSASPDCDSSSLNLPECRHLLKSSCPAWRNGVCVPCAAGNTNATSHGAYSHAHLPYCSQCPIGFSCHPDNGGAPVECLPGTFSGRGQTNCTFCPPGSVSLVPGAAECTPCATGFRCDASESLKPIPCPAGTFQPLTGQATCDLCDAGKYSQFSQRDDPSSCVTCPPGRFSSIEGAALKTDCKPCAPGSASLSSGVAACQQCMPGTYQSSEGQLSCFLCGANTYQPQYNSSDPRDCHSCPPETPYSVAGSGSQLQCTGDRPFCPPGYYTAVDDFQLCKAECPPGSMCIGGVVIECPRGSYAPKPLMSTCIPCGAGRYGFMRGSSLERQCLLCQCSSYSAALVTSKCDLCPVGTTSWARGATSIDSCNHVPSCLTSHSIARGPVPSDEDHYCANGATVPIKLSQLLDEGVTTLHHFMVMTEQLNNASSSLTSVAATTAVANKRAARGLSTTKTDQTTKLKNAIAAWLPLKLTPSLRMTAFGSDEVLSSYGATNAAFSNTSTAEVTDPTRPSVRDSTMYILFGVLLSIAFIPWLFFRWLPASLAVFLDNFRMYHKIPIGSSPVSSPTQLGAAFTWTFIWVAVSVGILLGTQSNTISTTELVPPSAAEFSDTALASWQITLRAYTGDSAEVMAEWCHNGEDSSLIIDQTGLSKSFTLRTASNVADGRQSCDIAADCLECGMDAAAYISFSLPYNAQLIEWELWLNSAQAGSWSRSYGVRAAPLDTLQPVESSLGFTLIESYFVDSRTPASFAVTSPITSSSKRSAARSGFEFSFVSAETVTAQPIASFSGSSSVGLTFAFKKSDVILRTQLTNKQTALQMIAVIASMVVSLFTLFGLIFKLLESSLFVRCGWSSGPIVRDDQGVARLRDDLEKEKALAKSLAGEDDDEDERSVQHSSLSRRSAGSLGRRGEGSTKDLSEQFLTRKPPQKIESKPREFELSLSVGSRSVGIGSHPRHSPLYSGSASREARLLADLDAEIHEEAHL